VRYECVSARGDTVRQSFKRQTTTPAASLASGQGAHQIQPGTSGLQVSDRHSFWLPVLSAATSPQQPIVGIIIGATLCRTIRVQPIGPLKVVRIEENLNFVDMHQPPPANNKPDFRGLLFLCCRTNGHRPYHTHGPRSANVASTSLQQLSGTLFRTKYDRLTVSISKLLTVLRYTTKSSCLLDFVLLTSCSAWLFISSARTADISTVVSILSARRCKKITSRPAWRTLTGTILHEYDNVQGGPAKVRPTYIFVMVTFECIVKTGSYSQKYYYKLKG